MISKHVDLIAIALLLAVLSLCAKTRQAFVAGMQTRAVALSHYKAYVSAQVPRIRLSMD